MFASVFEIFNVMKKAIIPIIIVRARIVQTSFDVSWIISEIALAEPVRDLFIKKTVTKDKDIRMGLIVLFRIKNCSLLISFVSLEPIAVACELPSPGRKEQGSEIIELIMVGLIRIFLSKFSISVFCGGIFVFSEMEAIIPDVPNRPLRSGRSG